MYRVQGVVIRAIYLYLVLFTYSMNKCMRPFLATKATEVNEVDQMSVFIEITSKPSALRTQWSKVCAQDLGIARTKKEVLMRNGSFAVIIRELVKNDFCRAWLE